MSEFLERHERSFREYDIAQDVLLSAEQICRFAETRTLRELGSNDEDNVDAEERYCAIVNRCRSLREIQTELESMLARMRLEM